MGTDVGLLILRLMGGAMMLIAHGQSKLMNFKTMGPQFVDPIGLGPEVALGLVIFAEVGCAFLITIGYKTRMACVPLLITMLVAAFYVHARDPWAKQEFALLYAGLYITLILTGAGRFSLDQFKRK